MSQVGRPRKFDQTKRAEVCALLAAGVSVREAARFVGCDRGTIRNEARRNDQFRHQLQRARSQAQVHPLRTMQQAAATNWRAAAWWLERLAPDTFAEPAASVVGRREANKFAADLIAIIERVVADPLEREQLYDLLTAAMPAAMRRVWDHRQSGRKLARAIDYFQDRRTAVADFLSQTSTSAASPTTPLEPPPASPLERMLTTLKEQLQQPPQALKRATRNGRAVAAKRSAAIGRASAAADNSPPADDYSARPENHAARKSPLPTKRER
jgi:hypothetical protein